MNCRSIKRQKRIVDGNVNLLFRVADRLMRITGEDIRRLWGVAWVMHVEGFHEKGLEKLTIEPWIEDVRKLLEIAYGKEGKNYGW